MLLTAPRADCWIAPSITHNVTKCSRWIKNNSSLFFGLFIFACITPVWGYFLSMRRNEREGTKGVYSNLSEMWRNTQSPAVLSFGPLVRELELKLFSRGGRHDARERAKVVRSILRRPRGRRCGGWPTQAAYIYIYITYAKAARQSCPMCDIRVAGHVAPPHLNGINLHAPLGSMSRRRVSAQSEARCLWECPSPPRGSIRERSDLAHSQGPLTLV